MDARAITRGVAMDAATLRNMRENVGVGYSEIATVLLRDGLTLAVGKTDSDNAEITS